MLFVRYPTVSYSYASNSRQSSLPYCTVNISFGSSFSPLTTCNVVPSPRHESSISHGSGSPSMRNLCSQGGTPHQLKTSGRRSPTVPLLGASTLQEPALP